MVPKTDLKVSKSTVISRSVCELILAVLFVEFYELSFFGILIPFFEGFQGKKFDKVCSMRGGGMNPMRSTNTAF